MAWIETHQELPEHPKTDALMDALGCERPTAVGHVIMSLLWALRYAHDGVIIPKRLGAIARGAGWASEPLAFASAMVEAGWWDVIAEGWKLHDWDVYAGMLIAKREKDAARKRGERGQENPKPVRGTSDGRPSDVHTDGAGTIPNQPNQHDQPNKTDHALAREEFSLVESEAIEEANQEQGGAGLPETAEPEGEDRSDKVLSPPPVPARMLEVTIPAADPSPAVPKRGRRDYTNYPGFVAFWGRWQGDGDKPATLKRWLDRGLERNVELREQVMAALDAQIADRARAPAGGFYPPWKHAERWIDGERWNDKPRYPAGPGRPLDAFGAPALAEPARDPTDKYAW